MRLKKRLTFIIAFFCSTFCYAVQAQQFSYVYIQGDKQTPFYVKLEGEMQPRYGKNYSIISQLAPGTINIEILFQQNLYPPQRFAIKVPENGSRAFLLSKKGSSFSLYDLQQQFYIAAGNSAGDDHMPTYNPGDNYVATNRTAALPTATNSNNYNSTYNESPVNTQPVAQQYSNTNNTARANTKLQNKEPEFIDNIALDNERTVLTNTEPVETNNTVNTEPEVVNTEVPEPRNTSPKGNFAINNECPQPIGDNAFQDIYVKMNSRTDQTRLKYLLGKMDKCYTSSQVRILAKGLGNDPERYAFLKQVYPRITDQGNFASMENLLTTREWKDYFRLIMP